MTNNLRIVSSRIAGLCLLLVWSALSTAGQEQPLKINYRLAMSHPSSHLFEVSIEVETPPEAKID